MLIDDDDLKILQEFIKIKGGITSWKLMKKIYPKGKDLEHMRILTKIRKMSNYGLFDMNGGVCDLIADNVKLRKMKLEKKEREFICIFICGKWSAFEI